VQEKIAWSSIVEFIVAQDAELAQSFVGVPRSRIAAVEDRYRIRLPSVYIEFLQTMGESAGRLALFGASRDHQFSHLLAQLPSSDYPTDLYFKVASESDPRALAFEDFYLDLKRSDDYDAPLVSFERPLDAGDEVEEQSPSFIESVVHQVFWSLRVAPRKFGARILVLGEPSSWSGPETKQDALDALVRIGFSAKLPDLLRVACVERDTVSAVVSISETVEIGAVKFGADTRDTIDEAVQELLAALPGAELKDPPAPRGEFRT
jgi:hypothetical protein